MLLGVRQFAQAENTNNRTLQIPAACTVSHQTTASQTLSLRPKQLLLGLPVPLWRIIFSPTGRQKRVVSSVLHGGTDPLRPSGFEVDPQNGLVA